MKIGRLYTKIFFCFLAILVLTQLLTFGLFIYFPGKYFHERLERYAKGHATLVKAYLEEKVRPHALSSASAEGILRDFTMRTGKSMAAGSGLPIPIKSPFSSPLRASYRRIRGTGLVWNLTGKRALLKSSGLFEKAAAFICAYPFNWRMGKLFFFTPCLKPLTVPVTDGGLPWDCW